MLRTRIILVAAAAVLVIIIFNLPKVVVENETDGLSAENQSTSVADSLFTEEEHTPELQVNQKAKAQTLKQKLELAENSEKSVIFADSLAKLYLGIDKYDSAAKFIEIIAANNPTVNNFKLAGNTYYEAYGFAMAPEKQALMGEKAREYFNKVLELAPDDLDAKNKLAMTYLSTSNPMQGITMLREILEKNPKNESAIFNLGVLSMQSGQYDKAVIRFQNLVEINPEHIQGQFFLGVSLIESGKKEEAKQQFMLVKELDEDPAIQATVDSYLEDIE